MVQLCNRGLTDLAAIDLLTVRRCYGNNSSVTKMCDILCRAKAEGYHPNLANRINKTTSEEPNKEVGGKMRSSVFRYCFTATLYYMSEGLAIK